MGQFDGKVVLVTGAASGIGRASVRLFAGEGAQVVAADIDLDGAEQTAELVRAAGGDALAVPVDVADSAAVAEMVARTVETYGRLDVAHNNAGIMGAGADVADMDDDVWQRGIDVMLSGVFYCMKHEIPHLEAAGGGAIVNTSSGAGLIGFPGQANYVAAKHGVIGLTRSVALEVIGKGIRVNAICPGTARSRMVDEWMQGSAEAEAEIAGLHPIGRIAEPEEIAQAAVWLASPAASFVVGVALPVDGGYTVP
ncbi:SDR family NAD(P)-dependent oxidoreductase [Rhabdothermincola salaria]|uniref:SDR family NAD(P)-dependent oxidoreductase n=1 Tax=Rhabdothermincola salaria TaxID=2903142 RepID=UPI001E2B7D8E|nr:glucose 1-dehydrogenase [Rhabdothermincola salaria]MCD9624497.1 SDR family oxidoreductase [Rhabdothermincola salaria]